ncbi:MAG: UPF0104 family protein [Planctomycetota bacterium]|nr:MAG: UPF0104 family protein [Planctomycetota bacterium]
MVRSLARNLLKLAVAAALVAYVAAHLEWRDALEEPAASPAEAPILHPGRIAGDWRSGAWTFRPDREDRQPPGGPGGLDAASLPDGWRLRPGFPTLLRGLDPGLYALGVGFWALLLLIVAWRWTLLLAAAGVPAGYGRAMRLCFIGYFFNNVLPGLTGGDLVRAVLVTRGLEERRARAAISVFVDRIVGLFGLLALGVIVLFTADLSDTLDRPALFRLRLAVLGILVLGLAGTWAWLSPRVRRRLRLDSLLARLPLAERLQAVDDAVTVYRHHPGRLALAFLAAVVLQAAAALSFWAIAAAVGGGLGVADVFAVFPVVQSVSAVPVAPAGWGIGESLFGRFFAAFGSTFTLGVAASVVFRLTTQLGVGLVGGLVWVLSRERRRGASAAPRS